MNPPSRWEFFKSDLVYWAWRFEKVWNRATGKCNHCGQRGTHKFSCYGYDAQRLASKASSSDDSRYGERADKWFEKNAQKEDDK